MSIPELRQFLINRGVPETTARAVIGKWLKQHSDGDLVDAYHAAREFDRQNLATGGCNEPIPWITATLKATRNRAALPPEPRPVRELETHQHRIADIRTIGELVISAINNLHHMQTKK